MSFNPIIREEIAGTFHGIEGRFFAVTVKDNSKPGIVFNQKFGASKALPRNRRIHLEVRYDDNCGNGHNSFAITGHIIDPSIRGADKWECGGCIHDELCKAWPELKPLVKWHLTSSDSPMYYAANTIYHASNRDYNGLLKDERGQIINGKTKEPAWQLVAIDGFGVEIELHKIPKNVDGFDKPNCPYTLEYRPWHRVGEGKERNFDAARDAAVWPEATDEQLSLPRDELKALLDARLPALQAEFRAMIETGGFIY